MNKIVYNKCFGGFGLSEEAEKTLQELIGDDYSIDELERHDSSLVEVVEHLGDKANDRYSKLVIDEITSDKYRISEYDGYESIETPDSIRWTVIE